MSVLRLLSPASRGTSQSPSRKSQKVTINIRIPAYGSVFMPFPNPVPDPDTPRTDHELNGDLEITIPQGMGRRRCKAIRVGIRISSKFDFGQGRVEEDILYESKVEVRAGNADGVVLEEGLQRFTFTLNIHGNAAPHNYFKGHSINPHVFAEIEGVEDKSWFKSRTSSRATSPAARSSSSRSSSPGPMTPPQSLNILRQEALLPRPPSYDLSEREEETPWLVGNHWSERRILLIYNPDPAGGVSKLDTSVNTAVPGLGAINVDFVSDQWTIAAVLQAKIHIPAPSPKVTIFFARVSLVQTAEVSSVRDAQTKSSQERSFELLSYGREAPKDVAPGPSVNAIWRGTGCQGEDSKEFVIDGTGKMPDDYMGRPSTLDGVDTPIKVSHVLRTEVYFSVQGEDLEGNALSNPDSPGVLRMMRMNKSVVVPACFLIHEGLDLPTYVEADTCPMWAREGTVCALCKTHSSDQFCRSCPPTAIPHPRHDHPPKLVGTDNGTCPLCSSRVLPPGFDEQRRDCACGLEKADIVERMKRVSMGEREDDDAVEERRGRQTREEKERAERRR